MITRTKLEAAKKRFNLSMIVFMALMFSGVVLHSWILGVGGFIGAFASSKIYVANARCPMCDSSLVTDSRTGMKLNFCPGCARSLDDEE
ncbi:hypothetical protein N9283_02330 [Akkermansiaceae bacterium]|nr:hypothetical protein [Akkermansiaceae bacterium]